MPIILSDFRVGNILFKTDSFLLLQKLLIKFGWNCFSSWKLDHKRRTLKEDRKPIKVNWVAVLIRCHNKNILFETCHLVLLCMLCCLVCPITLKSIMLRNWKKVNIEINIYNLFNCRLLYLKFNSTIPQIEIVLIFNKYMPQYSLH